MIYINMQKLRREMSEAQSCYVAAAHLASEASNAAESARIEADKAIKELLDLKSKITDPEEMNSEAMKAIRVRTSELDRKAGALKRESNRKNLELEQAFMHLTDMMKKVADPVMYKANDLLIENLLYDTEQDDIRKITKTEITDSSVRFEIDVYDYDEVFVKHLVYEFGEDELSDHFEGGEE